MRERLTRGGLSSDAVDRAISAYLAGDIHSLNLAVTKDGTIVCPIPWELLQKCFPVLASAPTKNGRVDPAEIRGMTLAYTINRHRAGKKSLTITWPGEAASPEAGEAEPASDAPDHGQDDGLE